MNLVVTQIKPAGLNVAVKSNTVEVAVNRRTVGGGGGGVTSHSALQNLDADDHAQYHNDARGDARYYVKSIIDSALSGKEPTINAGTTSDYWRGDKSWQPLNKSAVGLSNVDNTSDVNKPVSSAQAAINALKADLVGGVIPVAQIPSIAITDYLGSVASQAAMLALAGEKGDWCIRSDLGKVYVITGADPTQLADWTALAYPASSVWGSITGTLGDQADLVAALALLAPKDSPAFTTVANFLTGANQTQITSDANGPVVKALNSSTYLTLQSYQGIGAYLKLNGYSGIDIFNNTAHGARIVQNEFQFGNTTKLGWSSSGIGFAADASIRWLSVGKLIQREGSTAQGYVLANTWSDASNNETGGLRWDTNRFELFTDKLGTGSYRDLWILAGNPVGHRLKVAGSIIQDYYGGTSDARAGMNLDSSFNIFAQSGAVTRISSANSSMTGQATLELCSNTNTVTTQIIQPNVKDGGGGYTGAGHHLRINAGKGAAGNNNGGDLIFYGGDPTGSGVRGSVRFNNLPTSSAGLTTGAIWNNAGVINIV